MSIPCFVQNKIMGFISNVQAIKDKWERAMTELPAIGIDAIEAKEDTVLGYNKQQLREQGILPTGERLKPYAPSTVRIKQAEGKEWRFRTLLDTGAFQNGFHIYFSGNEFTSGSSDSKTSEIIAKEGNVFGWTSENERRMWTEVVRPFTIDRIKQITGAT